MTETVRCDNGAVAAAHSAYYYFHTFIFKLIYQMSRYFIVGYDVVDLFYGAYFGHPLPVEFRAVGQ